jgi:L-fucose dehydrogenase
MEIKMDTRPASPQGSPAIHRSGLTYQNKVVLITGGAKGIGEGCARVFVDAGAHVVILDIDNDAGIKLQIELNVKGPGTCLFIHGDASKAKDLDRFISEILKIYTGIDCLINNAGVHPPIKSISEFTEEEFLELLKINTVGPFLACKYALPYLLESHGSIINIGSLVSKIGQEGATIYAASKSALEGFTKSLAIELGPTGVQVNSILPSNIHTASRKEGIASFGGSPEYWNRWIDSNQLNNKSGTPEDVGQLCLCLATRVCSFMHGESINYSYGAELGYGPKYPFTFLDSSRQKKHWDLVNKPEVAEKEERIMAKL